MLDDVLRPVERGDRGCLDGRESAVVEVRFYPRERLDEARIADRKANAPAGH